ncbi:MAG: hypothetical protein IIC51_11120, partial [Planctomycetes bacterium]|nr:hypothetical protein [Planctomycetota bacterium]
AVSVGLLGLLSALLLGYLGHVSETDQTFFGRRYHIDLMGRPHLIEDDAGSHGQAGQPPGH